jgi:hypothetical protein
MDGVRSGKKLWQCTISGLIFFNSIENLFLLFDEYERWIAVFIFVQIEWILSLFTV